eukprot:m.84305 g.84305  ORF g.84305 m.84305 type:complete len:601 (+) comp16351_c0_seq41:497-2299(+)
MRISGVPRIPKYAAVFIAVGVTILILKVEWTSQKPSGQHTAESEAIVNPDSPALQRINLQYGGNTVSVAFHAGCSDDSLKEAIAGAIDLPPGEFSMQQDGITIAVSSGAMQNGAAYIVHKNKHFAGCARGSSDGHADIVHGVVAKQVVGHFEDEHGSHGLLDNGVVLSGRKASLPRVIITCLGTGRYRTLAIQALESARTYLGGDCLLSLHLLTDNVTGVDKEYNAAYIPYREWPMSGLRKFEDILTALEGPISDADYFYFMDGDVHFQEHVLLGDISGDMVAVEHPMYPRHDWGWCVHGKVTMCEYPYERKSTSQACIPPEYGKFKRTLRTGEQTFQANSWYLQSAFWGGKSKFIIPCLRELKKRVDIDVAKGYISSIIQDERYVNWWFWKHMNDSAINTRWLKPSYLYPFRETGFGAWIVNHSRPILVHGTAKAGKMIIGEAEIRVYGAGGRQGTCFDSFLHNMIGTYSCHDEEFRGGTQGFIWLHNMIRTSETIKLCTDGGGLKAGDPVKMVKCRNTTSQLWDYDNVTMHLVNRETKLCLDPMRFDKATYPAAFRKNEYPVSMQPCGKSEHQKVVITYIDVEASKAVAEKKKLLGQY